MSKIILKIILALSVLNFLRAQNHFFATDFQNFSFLRDFSCAVAKDELEKHPEMRTIALIELKNYFPSGFSEEIIKCLPENVGKIVSSDSDVFHHSSFSLPKESMVFYVVDEIEKVRT